MLKQIILIVIILAVLILSQQSYSEGIGKSIYGKIKGWGKAIWQECKAFWDKHILNKVTSEIEKRQNIAKEELQGQAKEMTLSVWQRIKNYLWNLFSQAPSLPTSQ